jgi:hypothetical protein
MGIAAYAGPVSRGYSSEIHRNQLALYRQLRARGLTALSFPSQNPLS